MKHKIIIGIILIFIFTAGYFFFTKNPTQSTSQSNSPTQTDDSSVRIISTVPDPLHETIIPADQVIEITFNKSLQNIPEFKVKIEPEVEFKVELSPDRKTAKIIPTTPYDLGEPYTLSIGAETKFDGVGRWGEEKQFRFRTVRYRGI